MTIDRIKDLHNAQPFRPFVLQLADGRQIPVVHRDFILSVPSGRTVVLCQPDDTVNIIDLPQVTDVELKRPSNGSRRRRQS